MNQQSWRKLISGETGGIGPTSLRFFLQLLAKLYSAIIVSRNFLYSKGLLKSQRSTAVVISIGNITTGGTGKTPLVVWLCNKITQNSKFKTQNYNCAILTRGYKAIGNSKQQTQNYFDEPAILAKSCPQAKVIVNPDRVAAATQAVDNYNSKVLIMDDGFQHRRLARNLDIVTIDCTEPFGYGKMLPAGLLREPPTSLRRADAVVITRSGQVTEYELTCLEEKLNLINPDMVIAKSNHTPVCARLIGAEEISLEQLRDKKVFAFCGIGNPEAFFSTVRILASDLVGTKIYNDHHRYTENCLTDIHSQAKNLHADLILSTQKDWTKTALLAEQHTDIPFAYLQIELKFVAKTDEDKITRLIDEALAGRISQ